MSLVYLAGPIVGLTFDEASDWRAYTVEKLAEFGIKGLSPLRFHEELREVGAINSTCDGYTSPLYSSRGVMTRDRWDATRCDALLVNLKGAVKPVVGTIMEIAWADLCRTPIIVVADENDFVANHAMVREATGYRTADLDEAIHIVKSLLL